MTNIPNPLTGTKSPGQKLFSSEANAIGSDLPRCLVNDGQSDLVANASVNGGTTKSFAFAGLTTFGVTSSGGQTIDCTTYTLTASGDVVINADANYDLVATGDVNLTAALDMTIAAGQDLAFSPTGTWGGAVAKLQVTGSGQAVRSPGVAFTDVGIRSTNMGFDPALHSMSTTAMGAYQLGAAAARILFELHLSPSCTYTSFKVRFQGNTSGTLPAALFNAQIYESTVGGTSVTLGPLATDPSANNAAYILAKDIAVTLTSSPLRPVASKRYFLYTGGHTGGGAATGSVVFGVKATGVCDRFGAQANEPI